MADQVRHDKTKLCQTNLKNNHKPNHTKEENLLAIFGMIGAAWVVNWSMLLNRLKGMAGMEHRMMLN